MTFSLTLQLDFADWWSATQQFPEQEHFKPCVYDLFLCHITNLIFDIWLTNHLIYKKKTTRPTLTTSVRVHMVSFPYWSAKPYCSEKRLKSVILILSVGITPQSSRTYFSNKKSECFFFFFLKAMFSFQL